MFRIIGVFSVAVFCYFVSLDLGLGYAQVRRALLPDVYQKLPPFINGEMTLDDNLNLSGKVFRGVSKTSGMLDIGVIVKNIDFSDSRFHNVYLAEYFFESCDFSGVMFDSTEMRSCVAGSNFRDAWINNSLINLTREQLLSTASYKANNLVGWRVNHSITSYGFNVRGVDFSGFDLRYCSFEGNTGVEGLNDCNFTDAIIEGATFQDSRLSIENLLGTRDFKQGMVKGIKFNGFWPDSVVNLSKMIFIDCSFGMAPASAKIDLTDSVISGCDFRHFIGLTLENVKSTWNYKHGRMEGIKLPPDIQQALDAEKEKR